MSNNRKVLIVDDDDEIRALIDLVLRTEGFDTLTAKNGKEAVLKTREWGPEVILMDLMMPIMDGYHASTEITNDATLKVKPKIIIVTSRDIQAESKLMEYSGACFAISKPFNTAELVKTVKEALG
ncbi:response regulator [Elusimicrobiota bacterium]